MKWRVILAVCFVLTLFAGFAYMYVNTFVRKHQQAVILFVVDGLDLNTLNLARQQLGRSALRSQPDDPQISELRRGVAYRRDVLNLDSLWNIALMSVQEAGQPVPDEGVDATALACGQRVDNGYVAMNTRHEVLSSLIYAAEEAQRATGLVTTSSLVEATPVAFYSNTKGTPEPFRNAEDLVYSHIDVILGGGGKYFVPASVENEWGRTDGRNLLDEAKSQRYKVVRTRDELNRISTWRSPQILGIFAPDSFDFSALQPEQSQQPTLAEMTRVAIDTLSPKMNGYFLVVEHGLVARAAEQNLGKVGVNEVAEVDDAIETAVEYAGPDALIMVTDSYSLGAVGPQMNPPPPVAPVVAMDSAAKLRPMVGPPAPPPAPPAPVAWLAGPGGVPATAAQQEWLRERYEEGWFSTNAPGMLQPQPAFRFQAEASPTAEPAWLASRGEGSADLRGFFNNTDLFHLITQQF